MFKRLVFIIILFVSFNSYGQDINELRKKASNSSDSELIVFIQKAKDQGLSLMDAEKQLILIGGKAQEIKRLAIRARDGEITVDEMTGGTFTITNGGVFGSMLSTPIINPPQSAILGMHNIVERPIAVDGKVEVHPIMYLALSYDHRIIDGKESVGFLVKIKDALENPIVELMSRDIKKSLEL